MAVAAKKKKGGGGIPLPPGGGPKGGGPKSGGGSSSSGPKTGGPKNSGPKGGGGKGGGKGGGGGGGGNTETGYRNRAADKYLDLAADLQGQAQALRYALNKGFEKARRQQMRDIDQTERQADSLLLEGYRARANDLGASARDNNKATAAEAVANVNNRSRERMAATTEALNNGAGETDVLRAQGMSLRNWEQNQREINRSHYDTMRSINSSLTDLTMDTKTARANNAVQANADREQLWKDYYNQKSEAWTQLGNIYGQQAEYYASAQEMKPGRGGAKKKGNKAAKNADEAFMSAAHLTGRDWDNPGVPKELREWEGRPDFESTALAPSSLGAQAAFNPNPRPEGATLRKW